MGIDQFFDKLKNLIPRETFGNFETIVIERGNTSERSKLFSGGPGKYQFEFVCNQDNRFSFQIGKASKIKANRFEGQPTERKTIEGKKKVKKLVISGNKFRMLKGDKWLVKVRAETFAKRDNTLEIYYTKVN